MQDDYAGAVNRFEPIAQQYCSLVDSRSILDKRDFLVRVYRVLPDLIAKASRLPPVTFPNEETEEQDATIRKIRAETEIKQQEGGELYDALKEKLGDWDLYSMVGPVFARFGSKLAQKSLEGQRNHEPSPKLTGPRSAPL
jgi:hypothetical protein